MMEKMRNAKKKKGFTLIELIVVIAILGILAAIAVPRFAGFTDRANIKADEQYGSLVANNVKLLLANQELTQTATQATNDVVITITPSTGAISGITNVTYTTKIADVAGLNTAVKALVPNTKTVHYKTAMTITITPDGIVSVSGTK